MPSVPSSFLLQLPSNSRMQRRAVFSLLFFMVVCVGAFIAATVLYDAHVVHKVTLRGSRIDGGWPPKVQSWSVMLFVGSLLALGFFYFMRDWKQPALALTDAGLFINQQLVRNVTVPYAEITAVEQTPRGYRLRFGDNARFVARQVPFFRFFVRYNVENDNLFFDANSNGGDLDGFFVALRARL